MAYNFNNPPFSQMSPGPTEPADPATDPSTDPAPDPTTDAPDAERVATDPPASLAVARFRSCRWQQPMDETSPSEFCTHREVKPYAGTTGFDADAWCPDCQYFKLRRAPKKREPRDDFGY